MDSYWINGWARWYQDGIIRIPQNYAIHPDFLVYGNESEVRSAFAEINGLFLQIFNHIAESPEEFGMPLHERAKYRYFSQQSRDSEYAPMRPFLLLHQLLTCGEVKGQSVVVSVEKLKNIQSRQKTIPDGIDFFNRKIVNAHIYFKKLAEYGFVFEGLKNNKITANDVTVTYPDNTQVLFLLKLLADKTYTLGRWRDFVNCNFRLLQDDMNTMNSGWLEHMMDRLHSETRKEFVRKLDAAALTSGLTRQRGGSDEGPGLQYFRNNNAVSSINIGACGMNIIKCKAQEKGFGIGLRIRNVANCLQYLENCPETVTQMFTKKSSSGCKKKEDGCKHGVSYNFNGESYWRCACCGTPFGLDEPRVEDIPHYIKLVELGEKK